MCWPGRGRSSQTSGAPQQAPAPYTDWGLCGSRRWAAGSASSPSSAGSRRPPSPHPAAPPSGSGWTETCCPSAWGQRDRWRGRWDRKKGAWLQSVFSGWHWPWDHQLLTVVDAVGTAVVVWELAADLCLDVIQLHLGGALWRQKQETSPLKAMLMGLTDINKKGFLVVYLQESSDFTCNYWLSSFIERRWRDVWMTEKHEQRATQQLSNIKKHFTAELCFTEAETKELDSFSSRTKKIWQKHADFSSLH